MHIGQKLRHERLLFFSDAVFAIAITLLVIEIRLPELSHGADDHAVARALLSLIPHYIGFLISFFVIGRFWVGHHNMFGFLAHHDTTLVWRNLLFLLAVAFMPFPTAVLSEFPATRPAVMLYGGWLTIAGLLNRWLTAHIVKTPALLAEPLTERQRRELAAGWIPVVLGLTAVAGAAVHPLVGIAILTFIPIVLRLFASWRERGHAVAESA